MKRKKSGSQKRISDMNKRVFYAPRSSHSLNLVNDATMSFKYAVSMFSTVKSLYDFFSSSIRCWDALKKYLPNKSLKPLSDTRWESRIDALTPLRFQIGGVYDALVQISEEIDGMTIHEAMSLVNQMKNYTFLTSLVIWYDILLHISVVSNTLQTTDINVPETVEMLEKTKAYFEMCRTEETFVSSLMDSKELAKELELEDLMLPQLKNAPSDSLDTKCRNLAAILQDHESSDIDALELREELKVLSTLLKPGIGPKETLKFIGRHNFCPNVNIALRILLTLPVTAVSGERSFSKLKLIKTYLQSTMSQTRLNDPATILIEHELAEDLNYTDRVKEFAQAKARKVQFV
ncbi:uncharacterized protein LOC124803277 [Schistocerca piceifrons]|uniref:uncharacterized protein LOC124803277 n=1 Tax=Schistocerca piceifrons TaxID=274613 RepID=UPI001F5F2635|nr:uncharacterized protein LOC124803277 [Schistocerca piceifrons]